MRVAVLWVMSAIDPVRGHPCVMRDAGDRTGGFGRVSAVVEQVGNKVVVNPPPVSGHPTVAAVMKRTAVKAWDDSLFGESAQAAFWQTLSLPPLLLGLLGSLGYIGGWFGPTTVDTVQQRIISVSGTLFSPSAVDQIIAPTITDILSTGRGDIVSFGLVISLWAGSSAMSSFIDSVAYGQYGVTSPSLAAVQVRGCGSSSRAPSADGGDDQVPG
jgi:hypothetical protein